MRKTDKAGVVKQSPEERESEINKIRLSLEALPKPRAGVLASHLYSPEELAKVKDPLFVRDLCRMLVSLFEGTSAPQIHFWKSQV